MFDEMKQLPTQTVVLKEIIWGLIHPSITEVAKGRFESQHYADAVEAALKEVNSVVKKGRVNHEANNH